MNKILHENQTTKQVDFVQTAPFLSAQQSVLRRKGIQANKIHLFCCLIFVQYFIHAFVLAMIYTEKQKSEIEKVREVFSEPLQQSPDYELLWSDKVGYVWLVIGTNPLFVDTATRIETAADLCRKLLDELATDVLFMTGNDHGMENADPLELVEIKKRWKKYIDQLPEYAYLCGV